MSGIFDAEFEKLKGLAEFGKKVIELAKAEGVIPKRAKRTIVTKTVVQYRKPRGPNKPKPEVPAAGEGAA